MIKKTLAGIGLAVFATVAMAGQYGSSSSSSQKTGDDWAPGAPYVKVSDALPLPEFLPGLGILFVDPANLPVGPFLAYDREGKLAATVYMPPLEALENGSSFDVAVGNATVTGTNIHYNAGHPGVEEPHVHVVLYHADDSAARLAGQ